MTVQKGGRWSAAHAYLAPALKRPNLAIVTDALATAHPLRRTPRRRRRIYASGGAARRVRARREVISPAAPINSPQLLKLSGIGPADELRRIGIEVVADRAGRRREPAGPSRVLFPGRLHAADHALFAPSGLFGAKPSSGSLACLAGDGLGATNHFEAGGFIRSRAGVRYPDLQFHFLPPAVAYDGSGARAASTASRRMSGRCARSARGSIRLRSRRPARQAADPLQLYEPCRRLGRDARLRPPDARDLRATGLRSLSRRGDSAGRGRAVRRGDRRLHPRPRRERLPPVLHLPDGRARRSARVVDPRDAGHRRRGPARRRLLDHAVDHQRQSQRADDHDRREGGRHDPRPRAAAGVERRPSMSRRTGRPHRGSPVAAASQRRT